MDSPEPVLSVAFFRSEADREPVREWIKSLPRGERRLLGEDIKTVQFGWPLGMPFVRKLDKGLWEVRSRLPGRIASPSATVTLKREHIGSDFDAFLKEDGLLAECESGALKRARRVATRTRDETPADFTHQARQPDEDEHGQTRPALRSRSFLRHTSALGTSRPGARAEAQDRTGLSPRADTTPARQSLTKDIPMCSAMLRANRLRRQTRLCCDEENFTAKASNVTGHH